MLAANIFLVKMLETRFLEKLLGFSHRPRLKEEALIRGG